MNNPFYFLGFPGYPLLVVCYLFWKAAVGMK